MDQSTPKLTPSEVGYLRTQLLGRLATVDQDGAPQNNPVGFVLDESEGQLLIGGLNLGASRKFRNVIANPNVAFVVDDLASVDPWVPRGTRCVDGEKLSSTPEPPMPEFSREVIRITPLWIGSWGIETDSLSMKVRRA